MGKLFALVPRHAGLVFAACLALTALSVSAIVDLRSGAVRLGVDASADRLLPEGDAARAFYDHVRHMFGSDETLLVAVHGGDAFDNASLARIDRLTRRLEKLAGVHHVLSLTNAVNVRGVDDDLEIAPFVSGLPLSPEALSDLREQVMDNPFFAGSLVSRDARTSVLVVYFDDMSHKEYVSSGLNGRIGQGTREEIGGEPGVEFWITGGPHVRAETAAVFMRETLTLPLLMLAVLSAVLAASFRTLRGVLLPLATIAVSVAWTLAWVVVLGFDLNAVTSMIPPLLTTLALSYSVHVVAEYYDVVRDDPLAGGPVEEVLSRVSLPVVITGLTTAVGFASLCLSPLGAVREFGLLSVVGVACTVVASLTFTPACLALLGPPRRVRAWRPRRSAWSFDRGVERVGRFAVSNRRPIFIGAAGLFALALFGASRLQVGTDQIGKFRPDAPVRVDFEAINENLQGSNLFHVVIESEVPEGLLDPDDLGQIDALQTWLELQPEIGGTASMVDYIKLINRGFNGNDPSYFAIPEKRSTVRQLLVFGGSDELDRFVDARYRTASIQVRARVMDSQEVSDLTRRIEARLAELPRRMLATVTGTSIVFNGALDAIIRGQATSVVAAFLIIYAILAAMFVSLRIGLIALIPNALPVAFYFGALGLTGIRLDPGMSLVAPMVLGIAVDDTIHYFARFIRESRRLGDEGRAAISALKSVGRPVTLTSLALCLGFLTLNASELATLATLGNMAALALAFAWATDMVLTPALCARLRVATLWDLLTIDLGRDPQHSIPLFRGLSARQARIVALMASMLDVPSGRRLFEAGEPGDSLYVVIQGRLQASLHQGGERVELATHERGGVCGEIGLFHENRTADVDVLSDARLLRLDQASIDQLGRRYPRVAAVVFRNLNAMLAERMTRATQRERVRMGGAPVDAARQARLETRGRALEDAFFQREADAFRSRLGDRDAGKTAPGKPDPAELVAGLTRLGIGAETLAALTLIPLVQVAWADGHMDEREKRAILAGAESSGIDPESPSFGLLRVWLERPPDPGLDALWRSYIETVCGALSVEARLRLRSGILGHARDVATSAGGVMGLGAISRSEEQVLSRLEAAFD